MRQKGVKVLARADFETPSQAAPSRTSDELLVLEPICCLSLVRSLEAIRAGQDRPFGPAVKLGQKEVEAKLPHLRIRAKAA